jgi:hypothetical protein
MVRCTRYKFVGDFPGTPVSSTYKTDRHDITEILLKVALNTIRLTHIYTYTTCIVHVCQVGITDACDFSTGAVLSQIQDGRDIAKAEKNYCITDKERLAERYF